jgi:hypothetical protein
MAILLNWDRLKSKMPHVAAAFTATAADSKLWLLVAFALIWSVLPRSTPIDWIFGAPIFVGMMLFLVAFNYARPKSLNDGSTIYAPTVTVSPQAPKDPQVERDLVLLLDFAVYQTTALMLDDLIRQAPSGIDEKSVVDLSGDPAVRYQTALDYVRRLVNKLDPGTFRGSAFRSLMYSAENEAERHIELTPAHERPPGIDPLQLRRYAIAHRQCWQAVAFLRGQKAEVEEKLRHQRSGLIERFSLRSPP